MKGFKSRSRSRRRKKTVKEKRAECRAQGLVYDAKTGKCRKSKRVKSKRVKSKRKSQNKNKRVNKILVDYAKWVKMIDQTASVTISRTVSKNNKAQINPESMKKILLSKIPDNTLSFYYIYAL